MTRARCPRMAEAPAGCGPGGRPPTVRGRRRSVPGTPPRAFVASSRVRRPSAKASCSTAVYLSRSASGRAFEDRSRHRAYALCPRTGNHDSWATQRSSAASGWPNGNRRCRRTRDPARLRLPSVRAMPERRSRAAQDRDPVAVTRVVLDAVEDHTAEIRVVFAVSGWLALDRAHSVDNTLLTKNTGVLPAAGCARPAPPTDLDRTHARTVFTDHQVGTGASRSGTAWASAWISGNTILSPADSAWAVASCSWLRSTAMGCTGPGERCGEESRTGTQLDHRQSGEVRQGRQPALGGADNPTEHRRGPTSSGRPIGVSVVDDRPQRTVRSSSAVMPRRRSVLDVLLGALRLADPGQQVLKPRLIDVNGLPPRMRGEFDHPQLVVGVVVLAGHAGLSAQRRVHREVRALFDQGQVLVVRRCRTGRSIRSSTPWSSPP